MQLADFITQLNISLSNTAGFAFNNDEITRILENAYNDKYACLPVWDDSLNFDITQYQYQLPGTLTTVSAVYIERTSTNLPVEISANLWEVVNGQLQFSDRAAQSIPNGFQLFLRGKYKVTTDDGIDDVGLQEYILALAAYNALQLLLLKKINVFLRNDTTVSDIIAAKREFYTDMVRWRQQVGAEFVNA